MLLFPNLETKDAYKLVESFDKATIQRQNIVPSCVPIRGFRNLGVQSTRKHLYLMSVARAACNLQSMKVRKVIFP